MAGLLTIQGIGIASVRGNRRDRILMQRFRHLARQHKRAIAEYQKQVQYVDGTHGVAVAVGDKMVALDVFDKSATCGAVWNRLLSGFVFDVLRAADYATQAEIDDVERLMASTANADWTESAPIGEGTSYRAQSGQDFASALLVDGTMIHGSVLVG